MIPRLVSLPDLMFKLLSILLIEFWLSSSFFLKFSFFLLIILQRDLFECRQKLTEAIKRQRLIEEKTIAFRKQLQALSDEERRIRRAIRIIEVNPSIVMEGNSESELESLRRSLADKEETVI